MTKKEKIFEMRLVIPTKAITNLVNTKNLYQASAMNLSKCLCQHTGYKRH